MRIRCWTVFPFVLLGCLAGLTFGQDTAGAMRRGVPNRPLRTELRSPVVEVPMDFRGHLPAVEVYVNGKGPFRFAIDTGGQGLARADVTLVEKLGLEVVDQVPVAPGRSMDMVEIDSIQLGGAVFSGGLSALSRDYNRGVPANWGHIDGILGFNLFADCLLTLDYPNRRVRIERGALSEPDGKDVLAMEGDDGMPRVTVTAGGRPCVAMVDAGKAGGLQLPLSAADELPLAGKPQVFAHGRTVHGDFTISKAQLDGKVAIGRHAFEHPELHFASDAPGPISGTPVFGADILSAFATTYDQRNGRVRFRCPDGGACTHTDTVIEHSRHALPMGMESGIPTVDVRVNGKGPFRFVVDSGADGCLIGEDIARLLDLPVVGSTRIGDPSEPEAMPAQRVIAKTLSLGSVTLRDVEAITIPKDPAPDGKKTLEGVIGLPLLANWLVTFDYLRGELLLDEGSLPAADGRWILDYQLDSEHGVPTVPLSVAGRTLQAHLDTGGMSAISFPGGVADELPLASPPKLVGKGRTLSGEFDISVAPLDGAIALGAYEVRNPSVGFNELMDKIGVAHIGSGFLAPLAITFDQRNNRLRLRPGEDGTALKGTATSAPQRVVMQSSDRPRLGIAMVPGGSNTNALAIADVFPGTPAAGAGLRPGDIIKTINGETAAEPVLRAALQEAEVLRLKVQRDQEMLDFEIPLDGGSEKKPSGGRTDAVNQLLERMEGEFAIQARMRRSPEEEFVRFEGNSTWTRDRYGRYVHEQFEMRPQGRSLKGEVFLGPTESDGYFELVQIDEFSRFFFHVAGGWDDATDTLRLERVWPTEASSPINAHPLLWVYRIEDDGSFVKEMHLPTHDGGFFLASDYHYIPRG